MQASVWDTFNWTFIGTKSIKRDMDCQNCQKSQRSIFIQHVISRKILKSQNDEKDNLDKVSALL